MTTSEATRVAVPSAERRRDRRRRRCRDALRRLARSARDLAPARDAALPAVRRVAIATCSVTTSTSIPTVRSLLAALADARRRRPMLASWDDDAVRLVATSISSSSVRRGTTRVDGRSSSPGPGRIERLAEPLSDHRVLVGQALPGRARARVASRSSPRTSVDVGRARRSSSDGRLRREAARRRRFASTPTRYRPRRGGARACPRRGPARRGSRRADPALRRSRSTPSASAH